MLSWIFNSRASADGGAPASSALAMEEWPKIRILVLGDSGVGKTCLVERLVTGRVPSTPRWTLGCNVQVMVHTMVLSTERKIIVEFWDIGGHRNFSDSRSVFYHQINGVFLVHDYSNKKSFNHLKAWLQELEREDALKRQQSMVGVEEARFGGRRSSHHQSLHQRHAGAGNNSSNAGPLDGLPILVVGNKCDGIAAAANTRVAPKMYNFDSLLTSATAVPGSSSSSERICEQEKFAQFFQRVYERRYG